MIGIDEVGRGAWAGPLLVVAYRPWGGLPSGVGDSKLISKKRRELLAYELATAGDSGLGWVSAKDVDLLGLAGAMRLAVHRALTAIDAQAAEPIILDGSINYCPETFTNVSVLVKADKDVPAVGAASIVAKVERDRHMQILAESLPGYGFERHAGYGTKQHQAALMNLGVSSEHRTSYEPIKAIVERWP